MWISTPRGLRGKTPRVSIGVRPYDQLGPEHGEHFILYTLYFRYNYIVKARHYDQHRILILRRILIPRRPCGVDIQTARDRKHSIAQSTMGPFAEKMSITMISSQRRKKSE